MAEQDPEKDPSDVLSFMPQFEWSAGPPKLVLAAFAVVVAVSVVELQSVLSDGLDATPAAVFIPTFLTALPLLAAPFVSRRRHGARALRNLCLPSGAVCTLIPHGRFNRFALYFWLVGMVTTCALAPFGAAAIPPEESGRFVAGFKIFALVSPVWAVVVVAFLGSRVIHKRGDLGIGLSSLGLYHWSFLGGSFYPWEKIEGLVVERTYGQPTLRLVSRSPWASSGDREGNWFGKRHWYAKWAASMRPQDMGIAPSLAAQAIYHYHLRPERRSELGTEAALERIRSGDFN